ncbi:MAG TPA: hypothetical protein ENK18_21715 [Deltaproteobacteria bacterium]|nr:hypothetical protein [Deltaproteobacteria bacterium]
MFHRHTLAIVCALLVGSCSGGDDRPVSQSGDPAVTFPEIQPPEVRTGWPCPPFDFDTTEDKVGDSDGDSLTDCQEEEIGSLPNNPDSDGDGVGDLVEVGSVDSPEDTDGDGVYNISDPDDDGDGVPTTEEDAAPVGDGDGDPRNDDIDGDGIANYLDNDDDNDLIFGLDEDAAPMGNGDGDPHNDDIDGDGIANYLDDDDDNDRAAGCEDTNRNFNAIDDDTDGDGIIDVLDTDDDGDGLPTRFEDWDGDGDACNDDNDIDGIADFQDLDEDNDTLESTVEDLNGNQLVLDDDTDFDGVPNYRDPDDDGDGVITLLEDLEFGVTATTATGVGDVFDDDTDGDGIPNFLDTDDDGDRCLTIEEHTEGDPPIPLDEDANGVADYLEVNQAGCASPRYDLRLNGEGFGSLNGTRIRAVVLLDGGEVVGGGEAIVAMSSFTLGVPVVLAVGEAYQVDLFADENDDGSCGGTETSWRVSNISTTGVPTMTEVDVASVGDLEPSACNSFP